MGMTICADCGDTMRGRIPAHEPRCPACRLREGNKICASCVTLKPLTAFHKNPHTADGHHRMCGPCRVADQGELWGTKPVEARRKQDRQRRARSRFDLTLDEYEAYFEKPCAVCGGPSTALDHDHVTGVTRDALCANCNSGLGMFQDNPFLLEMAAAYLIKHDSLNRWV